MEADPAQAPQSLLVWILAALGWRYTLLLPLAGLVAFVLVLLLVLRGRGWAAGAATVLVVPLPFLVGILGTIDGAIGVYMMLASLDVTPKPSVEAEAISTSLVAAFVGMLLMVPSYGVAVVGLLVRSFGDDRSK